VLGLGLSVMTCAAASMCCQANNPPLAPPVITPAPLFLPADEADLLACCEVARKSSFWAR
jgi:hypothetical protein